jgi:hypothetical protein
MKLSAADKLLHAKLAFIGRFQRLMYSMNIPIFPSEPGDISGEGGSEPITYSGPFHHLGQECNGTKARP